MNAGGDSGAPPAAPADSGDAVPHYLSPFSFDAAWSQGWSLLKSNYGLLLGVVGFMVVIALIDQGVIYVLKQISVWLQIAWSIFLALCVTIPLNPGMMLVAARTARGRRGSFSDLFLGYSRYAMLIGWTLLVSLVVAIALAPGAAIVFAVRATSPDSAFLVALALLCVYFVLFVVIGTRLQFVGVMLVDPDLPRRSLGETIKDAWETTRDDWVMLFLLNLTTGLVAVLTLLLLCVGAIVLGYPLWIAVTGCAYAMLVGANTVTRGGRCRYCGYDLTGFTGQCPECGAPVGT